MRYAQFGVGVDINAIIYRAVILIPAFVLYFVSALMGILGIVSSAIERRAAA